MLLRGHNLPVELYIPRGDVSNLTSNPSTSPASLNELGNMAAGQTNRSTETHGIEPASRASEFTSTM